MNLFSLFKRKQAENIEIDSSQIETQLDEIEVRQRAIEHRIEVHEARLKEQHGD